MIKIEFLTAHSGDTGISRYLLWQWEPWKVGVLQLAFELMATHGIKCDFASKQYMFHGITAATEYISREYDVYGRVGAIIKSDYILCII